MSGWFWKKDDIVASRRGLINQQDSMRTGRDTVSAERDHLYFDLKVVKDNLRPLAADLGIGHNGRAFAVAAVQLVVDASIFKGLSCFKEDHKS